MRKIFFFIMLILLVASDIVSAQLPIKTARTISFTTEEGSNMSVDISPDGKTIVFDLLGDLYTVPSQGGLATQITQGVAVKKQPVWSPKGDKIAYISDASGDNRLTVIDVCGNNLQTFGKRTEGTPVWIGMNGWLTTPTHFFEAYPLYHLSGGEVQLPKDIYDIVGSATDGKLIYYRHETESGRSTIYQYDTSTGVKKILTELEKDMERDCKVSKNGLFLSYLFTEGTSCKLILFDVNTKKKRVLANWQQNVPPDYLPNYNFSADCKKIAIGYAGKIHLIELETGMDEIVSFTANVKVDMGGINDARFKVSQDSLAVKYIRSAHSSPDEKHLIFAAMNRIYIKDLPNGKPRILINQPFNQFHPSWSPDSKWITYVSWSDKDFGQVWKVDIKGENLNQVTNEPATYHYPCWSPDGKSIVVNKAISFGDEKPILVDRDCGYVPGELLSISLKDKKIKVITDSISVINRVVYSADGESFIYKPDIRNSRGKYLMSINKKLEKKTLAIATNNNGFNGLILRQIVLSPDEKYVVFTNEENLHLVPVPPKGTPTLLYDQNQKLPVIRFAKGGFDPHWEQDGKILSWSYANQYFQINPERVIAGAIDEVEKRSKDNMPRPEILDIDITPDRSITIDLKVPQKLGKGLFALKNVRIITMNGGNVIEKGTVLIKDGRFLSVGSDTEVKIPKNVRILDFAGKTIMPGLIDLHDHLYPPSEIFPQADWKFIVGLAYGTTTAREPSGGQDGFGYQELVATGQKIGPRFFNVGHAVREGLYSNINNLEEARIVVQNRARMGAVAVKQYTQSTRLKRQLLLQACEETGVNMTNEAEQDMPEFITHLKDGTAGIEHNPLWGEVYNDVIQLIAKSGVYLTPTLQAPHGTQSAKYEFNKYFTRLNPKLTRFYPEQELVGRNLQKLNINPNEPSFLNHSKIDARIRHAGGKVTMGSHGEDPGLGAHFEIWALQMGGLTNMEALESATILAAGALGMQQDLGSIEPGKIADLIILNKNPLDDIKNTIEIQSVMKDGVLYDGNTLDEIWPVKKKFKYTKSNY